MRELIERLEKATDFDRELDVDIGLTIWGWDYRNVEGVIMLHVPDEGYYPDHPGSLSPCPTGSVDAAIALADYVLPGRPIAIIDNYSVGRCGAFIGPEIGGTIDLVKSTVGIHSSRAIALCIAILKAKEASNDA